MECTGTYLYILVFTGYIQLVVIPDALIKFSLSRDF